MWPERRSPFSQPLGHIVTAQSNDDGTYDVQFDAVVTLINATEDSALVFYDPGTDSWLASSGVVQVDAHTIRFEAGNGIGGCNAIVGITQPFFWTFDNGDPLALGNPVFF